MHGLLPVQVLWASGSGSDGRYGYEGDDHPGAQRQTPLAKQDYLKGV